MNVSTVATISYGESPYFAETQQIERRGELKDRIRELYSNETIVNGLKTREQAIIKFIYKNYFPPVRYMITSNSGTQMDAEDVFQDALMIIFKKIGAGCLKLTCAFSTYLFAICKNVWLQKLNKHGINVEYKDVKDFEKIEESHNIESLIEDNEKFKLYQQHFEKLNEDDQKILRLFLQKVPLAEIATIMGYSSYEYAKVRKYLVKEKLKNAILSDPRYHELTHARELSVVPA